MSPEKIYIPYNARCNGGSFATKCVSDQKEFAWDKFMFWIEAIDHSLLANEKRLELIEKYELLGWEIVEILLERENWA